MAVLLPLDHVEKGLGGAAGGEYLLPAGCTRVLQSPQVGGEAAPGGSGGVVAPGLVNLHLIRVLLPPLWSCGPEGSLTGGTVSGFERGG